MELQEQITDFAGRIEAGLNPYISYDEIQQWPPGRLDELMNMGILIETNPAKTVICKKCDKECSIEPSIEALPRTGEIVGLRLCTAQGMIRVEPDRLRRWEIVTKKLEELGYHTLPNSCIEIDLNQFSENKKAEYDFKQEMETLASQGYIKYPSNETAKKAARRIRERLKSSKYDSIKLTQDKNAIRLDAGIQIILKK